VAYSPWDAFHHGEGGHFTSLDELVTWSFASFRRALSGERGRPMVVLVRKGSAPVFPTALVNGASGELSIKKESDASG